MPAGLVQLNYASPPEPIEIAIPACRAVRPNAKAHVPAALIGVVDQPRAGTPAVERHLERVDDERRARVGGIDQPTIAREKMSCTAAR